MYICVWINRGPARPLTSDQRAHGYIPVDMYIGHGVEGEQHTVSIQGYAAWLVVGSLGSCCYCGSRADPVRSVFGGE